VAMAAHGCSLAGSWVSVSASLDAMARTQFCVYGVEEHAGADGSSATFAITKRQGGCWGGHPCCGWWSAAAGRRTLGPHAQAGALTVNFTAPNGSVTRQTGVVQPDCATFDLSSGEMYVRSNVSVYDMAPLVWLKTMTALTVRAARQVGASARLGSNLGPGATPCA